MRGRSAKGYGRAEGHRQHRTTSARGLTRRACSGPTTSLPLRASPWRGSAGGRLCGGPPRGWMVPRRPPGLKITGDTRRRTPADLPDVLASAHDELPPCTSPWRGARSACVAGSIKGIGGSVQTAGTEGHRQHPTTNAREPTRHARSGPRESLPHHVSPWRGNEKRMRGQSTKGIGWFHGGLPEVKVIGGTKRRALANLPGVLAPAHEGPAALREPMARV